MFKSQERLQGFTPERLVERMGEDVGVRIDEARRLIGHVVQRGNDTLVGVENVRGAVRRAVDERVGVGQVKVVARMASSVDPFVKYVIELEDGARVETVRIPLHKEGRFSVCVSSQVGCALGCRFCATATMGLLRHLQAWEIVEQVRVVARELRREKLGRVHGIVFQGMGEPLHNVDNVLAALEVFSHPCGIAVDGRQVTVCTAGMVPGIRELARRGTRARLAISVTTAQREKRRSLMPIEQKYGLDDVMSAAREFYAMSGRRIMLSLPLLAGVNTTVEDAQALATLLGAGTENVLPVRLSLVDHNVFEGSAFTPPGDDERNRFIDALSGFGVPVVRRYSGGADIGAACGQLVTERAEDRAAE